MTTEQREFVCVVLFAQRRRFVWFRGPYKMIGQNKCLWLCSTKQQEDMNCDSAARHGDLQALKRARKNGCVWSGWTCAYAAMNGHIDVIEWAIENGCNHDRILFSPSVVQSLCKIGCFLGSGCLVNKCSSPGRREGLCVRHKLEVRECLYDLGLSRDTASVVVGFVTAV